MTELHTLCEQTATGVVQNNTITQYSTPKFFLMHNVVLQIHFHADSDNKNIETICIIQKQSLLKINVMW